MSKRLNMNVERLDYPWKIVPLSLILYQLPRVLGVQAQNMPKLGKRIGIPVNLFDAMRVILKSAN